MNIKRKTFFRAVVAGFILLAVSPLPPFFWFTYFSNYSDLKKMIGHEVTVFIERNRFVTGNLDSIDLVFEDRIGFVVCEVRLSDISSNYSLDGGVSDFSLSPFDYDIRVGSKNSAGED